MRGLIATAAVFAGLAAFSSSAFAQDYEQTEVSNQLATIPTGATQLTVTDDSITEVELPFEFPYYGGVADRVFVHDNGMMNIRPGGSPSGGSLWANTSFPPVSSGVTDGCVAPLWEDINPAAGGQIGHFTTGTAPNRRFVVYWNSVRHFYGGADQYTFQVHLYETSGRIVFAYGPDGGTWGPNLSYSIGIAAPGSNDTRFVSPNTSANNTSHPGTDYQFDPTIRTYDGTILIDEIVSDDSGIGNSTNAGVAPEGLRVELRSDLGTAASAILDENGEFELRGVALDATLEGALFLVSSSASCRVTPSTAQQQGAPYAFELTDGIAFDDDAELGTMTVGAANDAAGTNREPMQIALAISRAHAFLADLTETEIPLLEVWFSGSDQARSRYQEARGEDEAYLRIGGSSSGNPDGFDAWICQRGWARHALKHLTGLESSTTTMDFDRQTDDGNALADALGAWIAVSLTGDSVFYDGINGSTTEEFDLETPSLTSPRGRDVGAWFASAIFDLMDAANETHDNIDGTSGDAASRPFDILLSLEAPFTLEDFIAEWDNNGFDSPGLVRNFVHHGLLVDDGDEPNDTADEATDAGTAGVRLDGRSLNKFNEDWYKVQVVETNTRFYVNVAYNRTAQNGVLLLELRTADDRVLATGEYDGDNGPMRAELPVFGPGELFIRLAHVDGDPIQDYTLQAFAQLTIGTSGAPEWTVKRPINQPIVVAGGIPPYELSVKPPATPPRGMLLDLGAGELRGSPLDVGTETFTIQVSDSGSPKNTASSTQSFTVHPELSFTVPGLLGVAQGKPADINLGRMGGTNPITLSDQVNELPNGIGLTEDFHIAGTATEGGGGRFAFTATDLHQRFMILRPERWYGWHADRMR